MKYLLVLLAAALFLWLIRPSEKADKTPLLPSDTILAAGDSLTYGHGANPTESYPTVLSSMTGLRIVNAGKNGETSQEGLKRLPQLLQQYKPKLTLLCYGGNDILQKKSMEILKENLKTMISLIRANGSEVILIAVPDISLFGLHPLPLYEEVADETGTPLVSGLFSDILSNPSLKSDQVHPNAKGYRKMAETLYETIQKGYRLP